jgi:hypothetical protein
VVESALEALANRKVGRVDSQCAPRLPRTHPAQNDWSVMQITLRSKSPLVDSRTAKLPTRTVSAQSLSL